MAKVLGLFLVFLVAAPAIAYGNPFLVGHDSAYIVLSGSMEPTFAPGDIVFDEAVHPDDLRVGDMITFRSAPGSERLYTHRIIDIDRSSGVPMFKTQGDANEDPDPGYVDPDLVLGRVSFIVPAYGKLLAMAQSKLGLFVLILVPGALAIIYQMYVIAKIFIEMERQKESHKSTTGNDHWKHARRQERPPRQTRTGSCPEAQT